MSCYVILSHYFCILICILKCWALWSFDVCWSMEARLKTKPLPQGFDGRDQVYLLVKKRKQTLDYNNLQPHPTACIIKATGIAPAPLLLCHDECPETLAAVVWWVIVEEFVDLLTMKFSEATVSSSLRRYSGCAGQQWPEGVRLRTAAVPRGHNRHSRWPHLRWIPDRWVLDFDWFFLLPVVRETNPFCSVQHHRGTLYSSWFCFCLTCQGDESGFGWPPRTW